jgi:geranylgeranyl diphosphate synthase type I
MATPAPDRDARRAAEPDVLRAAEPDVLRAAELVQAGGGRRWAEQEAQRRMQRAADALHNAPLDHGARAELLDIARFVVAREA